MLKKQSIKLKEQAESITLREAGAVVSAEPDNSAIEIPPAAPRAVAEVAPPQTDLANPAQQTDHSEAKQKGSAVSGDLPVRNKPQKEAPIKGKLASTLSDADLTALATHPDSIEADWLPAFTELDKRTQQPSLPPKKTIGGKNRLALSMVVAFAALACATFWQFSLAPKAPPSSISYNPRAPYLIRSAQNQSAGLKLRAVIRLAQAIDARGWTPSKAASYLAANETEMAKIMRDDRCTFSMDELNKMLFAIGASTVFPNPATTEELQQTVAYFTRVIAINPNNTRAFDRRATAYEDLKQYELAIADLKRYVALNPGKPGPLNNLAVTYKNAGRYQEALQTLNDLHSLFPDYDIYQNRTLVYYLLGEYDKAVSDGTKSIAMMDSPRPGPYVNRALAYEELGKYKEAIADYKKVLEIDPTYDSAARMITKLKSKL